jgi:NTE family protein
MPTGTRALVLGGGGITGIAWELGLLAGLADAGLDLTAADLVIGTSAGSVVGAQITSGIPLEQLYTFQLREPTGESQASLGVINMLRFVVASAWPGSDQSARARIGRLALGAHTGAESQRREVFRRVIGERQWPARRLFITAVDAETGESKVFDRESEVPLMDAVAASCAVPLVWPPVSIGGRRYVDGGVRSIVNADLAAGYERVVMLAPITRALRRSARLSVQVLALGPRARSLAISPDELSRKAIGRNVLDPAHRASSARAGRAQASAVAKDVASVWANG